MKHQIVRNTTTGTVLAERARVATNFWMRFRGLMLRKDLPEGHGLIIQPCGSIHMFFMRIRIDAVFFSKAGVVTGVSRGLRPWIGFALGGYKVYGVIELPEGAAEGVSQGDKLTFETIEG